MSQDKTQLRPAFAIGDRVYVDSCKDITAIVTMLRIHDADFVDYEIQWWSNGELKGAFVDAFRLTFA